MLAGDIANVAVRRSKRIAANAAKKKMEELRAANSRIEPRRQPLELRRMCPGTPSLQPAGMSISRPLPVVRAGRSALRCPTTVKVDGGSGVLTEVRKRFNLAMNLSDLHPMLYFLRSALRIMMMSELNGIYFPLTMKI